MPTVNCYPEMQAMLEEAKAVVHGCYIARVVRLCAAYCLASTINKHIFS